MPNAAPISRTLPRTKPTAIIPAPCWSDPCPSNWTSHAPAADNFLLPPCPLVSSVVIARKPSPCCWACSVLAIALRRPRCSAPNGAIPLRTRAGKSCRRFHGRTGAAQYSAARSRLVSFVFRWQVRRSQRWRPPQAYLYLPGHRSRSRWQEAGAGLPRQAGRENLEDWKLILRSLLERGLRRVLIVVPDDFSGLLPITRSLFPGADVQLCVVHMQRNARNHLSKADNAEFQQRWRALRSSWDEAVGITQFEDLCQRFQPGYPSFMAELRKKRDHYLAFLKYPDPLRRGLSTSNVVEAVNGQLEILRRNSGGYFQSADTLKLKLGITITSLENHRWRSVTGQVEVCLHQLNAQFQMRFESES